MYCSVSWTRYTAIRLLTQAQRAARDRRPWPLSQVPVFGILVVADGKLYGGPEVKDSRVQPAMVYTQLADANKVLALARARRAVSWRTSLVGLPWLFLAHVTSEL